MVKQIKKTRLILPIILIFLPLLLFSLGFCFSSAAYSSMEDEECIRTEKKLIANHPGFQAELMCRREAYQAERTSNKIRLVLNSLSIISVLPVVIIWISIIKRRRK